MSKEEVQVQIEHRLAAREKSVRNRNAFQALFGAFSDPVGSLGKIFLGGNDAVDAERQRLQQDAIIDLLCKIDDAIAQTVETGETVGIEISGLIETSAEGGETVVGVNISADAGPVKFRPGTQITTSTKGVSSTTGLRVGGKNNERGQHED
jgi:hypothetical protein